LFYVEVINVAYALGLLAKGEQKQERIAQRVKLWLLLVDNIEDLTLK
jgi:hypothetical protein